MGGPAGTLLTTLVHHSDYVTSLACSPNSSLVATAGLRGELFLVDMEVRPYEGHYCLREMAVLTARLQSELSC